MYIQEKVRAVKEAAAIVSHPLSARLPGPVALISPALKHQAQAVGEGKVDHEYNDATRGERQPLRHSHAEPYAPTAVGHVREQKNGRCKSGHISPHQDSLPHMDAEVEGKGHETGHPYLTTVRPLLQHIGCDDKQEHKLLHGRHGKGPRREPRQMGHKGAQAGETRGQLGPMGLHPTMLHRKFLAIVQKKGKREDQHKGKH